MRRAPARSTRRAGVGRGGNHLFTGKGNPMGKRPVVSLVGLFWVGMTLTGCGPSSRQTYHPQPTFPGLAAGNPSPAQGWAGTPKSAASPYAQSDAGKGVTPAGGSETPSETAKATAAAG